MKRGVFLRELKSKMDNPRNKYERLRAKVEIIIANMPLILLNKT